MAVTDEEGENYLLTLEFDTMKAFKVAIFWSWSYLNIAIVDTVYKGIETATVSRYRQAKNNMQLNLRVNFRITCHS